MMDELLTPVPFKLTTFPADGYNEMIVERNISFFSLCEHHLAPFFGTATVAYIPGKRILGISKLCRVVELYSKRLQVQERMTSQIVTLLQDELNPKGVAVYIKARHLCQEMRGVRKLGAETITTALRGVFLKKPATRSEFLSMCKD